MAAPNIATGLTPLAVDIDTLIPLDGNPRKGDVQRIARSLRRFGQRKPIVARKLDGKGAAGEIIAGNHTYLAAKSLGWTKIAVILTDDDRWTARAYAIADNRASEMGGFDEDLLAEMLEDFASDHDLLEDIGWSPTEAAELLSKVSDKYDADEIPDSADIFDGSDPTDKYRQQYGVIVICDTESEQADTYARLQADGYDRIRVVTT